jgi:hypothetical protein
MLNKTSYLPLKVNHEFIKPRKRGIDVVVTLLIIYYWALQFTHGDAVELVSFDLAFYLYVIPAAGFAVLSTAYVVFTVREIDRSTLILLMFCGLVITISLARGDYRSIASLGLLGISIATIFQIRPRVSVNTVNILLIAATLITTIMYFFGMSIYTFVPGVGLSYDLWWRVSPYPSVAEGALLAMFVFLVNLVITGQRLRKTMLVISLYLVIFSGSRTAISSVVIASAYILLRRQGLLDHRGLRISFIVGSLSLFVILIYASQLIFLLPFADNALLRTLILRDEAVTGFDFGGQVGTAAIRQWVFDQHIAAFWESPFVGIGTFDLRMLNSGYGALDNSVTGSEAFVTGLLARIGLVSTLLFAAIFLVRQPLRGMANELSTAIRIALIVAMVTYGSFVNVYDVIFVLMIVAVAGGIELSPIRTDDPSSGGAPI